MVAANHSLIYDIFKEKTSLNKSDIELVIELIVFIMKRQLFLEKKIVLQKFGELGIFQKRFEKKKTIRIRRCVYLMEVIKKTRELKYEDFKCQLYPVEDLSKIFNIMKKQAYFLMNLFVFGLISQLARDNRVGFNYFGEIYIIDDYNWKKTWTRPFITKFKQYAQFKNEIDGKSNSLAVSSRLKTVLKIHNISCEIPKKS